MKQKGEKELKIHNNHAEILNDEGYQTIQGKAFTKVQVKRILDRESFY